MANSLSLLGRVATLRKMQERARPKTLHGLTSPQGSSPKRADSLLEFIPRATPRFSAPAHLARIADVFERILRGEPVRVVVSMPPRHGKTETLIHAIAHLLLRRPELQIAYVSYASTFAEDKSRKAREIAMNVGVRISPLAWARKNWRTGVADGGVWATAINGPITGQGFHVMIIDDPVKDRAVAESSTYREAHYVWFTDTAYTRIEPTGACVVVQTRWHPDDLAGRLIRDGWECINLPAIDDDGNALWPERWPIERLLDIKDQLGEYGWSSLYQGAPRLRGGQVFHDVHYVDALPPGGLRVAIGFDLAYTAKTYADYSVAIALGEADGKYYVLDVLRAQLEMPEFRHRLERFRATWPGAVTFGWIGGTEKGAVDLLNAEGANLEYAPAKGDKFVRAQSIAADWNAGKIILPEGALWAADLVAELADFTGVNDAHDDQIDALAAAHGALQFTAESSIGRYRGRLPKPRI
jgi:predicted phage terminase large subunit-like protein